MEINIETLETEMNRGFLQALVLVALEKKMYGYQMSKHLEESGYRVEENTLYPLLRRLEKNALVKSEWEVSQDRPKKFYVIAEKGKEIREKMLVIWREQSHILNKLLEENQRV